MRRRISFILTGGIIVFLVFINWSNLTGEMYRFDNADLSAKLEVLSFESKVLVLVPFEEMKIFDTELTRDGTKQHYEITLMNKDKDTLVYSVSNYEEEILSETDSEKVEFRSGVAGKYIPDDNGKRRLYWRQGEVNYGITYHPKVTPNDLSKGRLIEMAESVE
ncbi:hypothetical protein [Bacillus sp. Marseille-Q1617]|uniref:hypothetical protein n=1 Tax=Bacillus sp. Marseille-Q1617 TaxID=2736887 RepID=UPI001589C008|nr:hypothetical protein [Bacillus sp. Marseille-Q1617]